MKVEELARIKSLCLEAALPDRSRTCVCPLGKECDECNSVRAYHHSRNVARYVLKNDSLELTPKLLAEIDDLKRRLSAVLKDNVICEFCLEAGELIECVVPPANVGGYDIKTGNPICDGCAEACENVGCDQ